jgi:hypothetical protein
MNTRPHHPESQSISSYKYGSKSNNVKALNNQSSYGKATSAEHS